MVFLVRQLIADIHNVISGASAIILVIALVALAVSAMFSTDVKG